MLSTLLAILQFYSLPVGFTFFPPSRFYQRTHRPWLYQKSRLNLCDIFYIIMAPQPPCLCFVAALAILWLSQAFPPIPQVLKSRSPRQKLLKQISLTLLTFLCAPRGSFLFFSPSFFFNIPPLNEIYFSICYSCSLYVCGVSGLPESEMGRPSFLLPPSIATLLASLSARHRRLRLKHFELCAWQTLRKHKKTNKWQGRTKCRHTRYPWRSERLAMRCD